MSIFRKTIFTGFSPNSTFRDVVIATSFLAFPWKWGSVRNGSATAGVEEKISEYFDGLDVVNFDSGRTALYFALKSLGIGEGDAVLVQAYTCVVVINSIKWTGATPVFVDVDETACMNPEDLERKVTSDCKALIIQHTFGYAADLDSLLNIAAKHELKTIEDCAHSLGVRFKGKLTGTFADIGMLSFGSDKVISCARGGALITSNKKTAKVIRSYRDDLPQTPLLTVLQHLFHYPIFLIGKMLYHLYIGKVLLALAKKVSLLNKIIYAREKSGEKVPFYPAKMPNALAIILARQVDEIDRVNEHRRNIASIYHDVFGDTNIFPYQNESIYLRYPMAISNTKDIHARAKKRGVILGDWYNMVIAPSDSLLEKTGYKVGSCPNAEKISAMSINLPTNRNITKKQAEYVAKSISSYV
jgi:perosamine synthetase